MPVDRSTRPPDLAGKLYSSLDLERSPGVTTCNVLRDCLPLAHV